MLKFFCFDLGARRLALTCHVYLFKSIINMKYIVSYKIVMKEGMLPVLLDVRNIEGEFLPFQICDRRHFFHVTWKHAQ